MDGLRLESVDALSLDEALLLAHELPHLRDLIRGGLSAQATAAQAEAATSLRDDRQSAARKARWPSLRRRSGNRG